MSIAVAERTTGRALCTACLHPAEWHQHLRPGTDCSRCDCARVTMRRQRVLPLLVSVTSALMVAARARTWIEP